MKEMQPQWVNRFNESGFGTFEQVPSPKGRPPILRASQLRELARWHPSIFCWRVD